MTAPDPLAVIEPIEAAVRRVESYDLGPGVAAIVAEQGGPWIVLSTRKALALCDVTRALHALMVHWERAAHEGEIEDYFNEESAVETQAHAALARLAEVGTEKPVN